MSPEECLGGSLVVPGVQGAADRAPPTPRVTEKHIQEELVFFGNFLSFFSFFSHFFVVFF